MIATHVKHTGDLNNPYKVRDSKGNQTVGQVEQLKQKQGNLSKHMKPIITLLVVVIVNSSISVLFLAVYIPG